jgi:CRISPR-associated protein Csb2
MPIGVLDKGREKTSLVFDTWADVGDEALAVRWACSLDDEARSLFGVLAAHLGYLGRSESWVEAEAIADAVELPAGNDAFPHIEGRHGERGWEQISLMAGEPASAYSEWREQCVAKALEPFPLPEGKKPSKKLEKDRVGAVAPYPIDLVDALERDTAWWKRHGWSQPPGSRRVLYWRRSDALSVGPPAPAIRKAPARVTTMLLALTTPSGSRSALPMLSRALPQAELLHRALVARASNEEPTNCPELTGKDATGSPLTGNRHAHLLPLDLDGDGHLDHIVIYAPMGLGPVAQRAVRSLKRTWTKGGVGELQLALAGQGDIDDLRALPAPLSIGIDRLLGSTSGARVWTNTTPLVLPRYRKDRGANAFDGQVKSELACRGLPRAEVELLPWNDDTRHMLHAVRVRRSPARRPPVDAAFAVRLVFEEPVQGPIAIGYGAHFGLGLFSAIGDVVR